LELDKLNNPRGNMSLLCKDCNEYIFEGEQQLKDGVFVDDSYYSEAVCDECIENYSWCNKTETWSLD